MTAELFRNDHVPRLWWTFVCTDRGGSTAIERGPSEGFVKALTQSRMVLLTLLLCVLASAEGCAAVEGIFKAGFWVGIVIAVVVVAVVFGVVRTLSS
jgi:hypothetical protein